MKALRKMIGAVVLLIGVGVLAVGVYFVQQGYAAEAEIRDRMAAEAVATEIEGVEQAVVDAATATNQALLIRSHTLGKFGSYASMERTDPNRDVYLKGLTLRNALNMARMGFELSLMVKAIGAIFAVTGLGLAITGAVVYAMAARVNEQEERAAVRQASLAFAH